MTVLTAQKQKEVFAALKDDLGCVNVMQTPRIEKIVVSVGTGKRSRMNPGINAIVADRLAKITGQKPAPRPARQSIAGFKTREGDIVGHQVTLRGKRAETFFDKLIHIALPRTKDFRGVKRQAVDAMGNLSIGIREHSIFPECGDEELKDIFSLAVTIVTTAKDKEKATKYLEFLGVPFQES